MNSSAKIIQQIKDNNQDFEWYPTTNEILNTIKYNIDEEYKIKRVTPSVLDCGAGDGRSLIYLTNGDRYAIEKSQILIEQMDKSIFIVGTEFTQQTLIDKKVDVIFCNPPYSEYVDWMIKIVQEANSDYIYFVVPERWKENTMIEKTLSTRKANVDVLGSFDFLSGDRQARAKIEIVRIQLIYGGPYSSARKVDPFDAWFNSNFNFEINNTEQSKFDWKKKTESKIKEHIKQDLVCGVDLISSLESLYQYELDHLMSNYKSIEALDADLLSELSVNVQGLKGSLKQKIEGLKDKFWNELFENMTKITSKLTHGNRDKILKRLMKHTHIDFTKSNAYAILIWVIKQSNSYFDEQLIELVERMTEEASILLYKSNERTFGSERWRYNTRPESLDKYGLDYRIVLHRCGGINTSDSEYERSKDGGLTRRAYETVNDILTIANNLGYDTTDSKRAGDYEWGSGTPFTFQYYDHSSKKLVDLMVCKAFKNKNIHIKFNQDFICRLNVEFGRLKGWLKNHSQASQELNIPEEETQQYFDTNLKIDVSSNLLRLCN